MQARVGGARGLGRVHPLLISACRYAKNSFAIAPCAALTRGRLGLDWVLTRATLAINVLSSSFAREGHFPNLAGAAMSVRWFPCSGMC